MEKLIEKHYQARNHSANEHANITADVAVGFAEWLNDNNLKKKIFTHPNKVGQYYSDQFGYKPIQELFNLYLTTLK